jgi:hypothetical protein
LRCDADTDNRVMTIALQTVVPASWKAFSVGTNTFHLVTLTYFQKNFNQDYMYIKWFRFPTPKIHFSIANTVFHMMTMDFDLYKFKQVYLMLYLLSQKSSGSEFNI